VAGKPQKKYALKLGFDESRIIEGVYSADYDYFNKQFEDTIDKKKANLPHRFLYVGRYIERKGIKELWNAFIKLKEETGTDWELWCCGTGPLEDQRVEHPQIKHFGFVQPEQMEGSTFTVSNLGMFGIEEFTAIINPPNACILAVGAIKEVPVVEDGEIVPGKRMKVTLSSDHRIVDGAMAAQFLSTLKQMLESPLAMLL
jgi:glycosyltransferase involved in cell wall biosynthesis